MRIKHKLILIALVAIGAGCAAWFAYYAFKLFNESAERTRYYSAMSWLNASIREELDDYYIVKGHYPQQLTELSIPFPGDGAKPEMLNNFKYVTDGNYYEITWDVKYGNGIHTHKEHILKGKMLFAEYYVNGQLSSRNEFGEGMAIPKSKDDNDVSVKKYGNN
jgi:hypothetical protein